MIYDNNATRIKRELLIEIAKRFMNGTLEQTIDRIPLERFPRDSDSVRCCVYKDRAITKFRLMAQLGHRVEDEKDELTPLSEYTFHAVNREKPEAPILTVMQEACKSCVKANYMVTNACQGCVARPCTVACNKGAVEMVNGKAYIHPEKCVNCGRCQEACPYHAIIYLPVPCEAACPVNAIYRDENGKENIDFDKCIFCGKCMRECPFGAIMERSQIIDILRKLKDHKSKVTAMVAPSIVGQFPGKLEQIVAGIKKLGFDKVVEVAIGAEETVRRESTEWKEKLEGGAQFMTTSCCPAYTMAVKKHVPDLAPFVSHTPSPMAIIAKMVKEEPEQPVTVFIGPCVAKRQEALENPDVDLVMTFEELGSLFVAADIDIPELEVAELDNPAGRTGRIFAISGGVTTAIQENLADADLSKWKAVQMNGVSKKEMRLLKNYAKGKLDGNFLEVMTCEGGCVAGPGVLSNPRLSTREVIKITDAK